MYWGQGEPCDAKFSEKFPCSHNNTTALLKQISLFDTAIVMTNIPKVSIKNYFWPINRSKKRHGLICPPPPNTVKKCFTPIRLGLRPSTICPRSLAAWWTGHLGLFIYEYNLLVNVTQPETTGEWRTEIR